MEWRRQSLHPRSPSHRPSLPCLLAILMTVSEWVWLSEADRCGSMPTFTQRTSLWPLPLACGPSLELRGREELHCSPQSPSVYHTSPYLIIIPLFLPLSSSFFSHSRPDLLSLSHICPSFIPFSHSHFMCRVTRDRFEFSRASEITMGLKGRDNCGYQMIG